MCKTLVTTRTFTEPETLNVQWLNNTNVPSYVDYYFGGSSIPVNCQPGLLLTTNIPEPISKRKDTQYGIFNTDLFGTIDSKTNFEYKFKLNLIENNILSGAINDQCSVNNNTILFDIDGNLPALFQPLITNIKNPVILGLNGTDIFGAKYQVNDNPNEYASFGFTYESGVLKVYYIYQNLTNCDLYSVYTYESAPLTVSGNVFIQFIKNGNSFSFIVNGIETIININLNHFVRTTNTYFGAIGFVFYETRFLYSSVCSIYCKKDDIELYNSDFSDFTIGSTITINDSVSLNYLRLYNYNSIDIQDGNICCLSNLVASLDNFKDGCCFTPTKEDNIRYKTSTWFNNNFGLPYIADIEMMSKIGKSEESERLLKLVNQLNSFVMYLKFIRNKMICEEKAYYFFISDENITKFTEYFFIRGIDIKCLLEIMEIGNFKNCCGEVTPSVECTCKDEIPSAIISAIPYQFNLNSEANQTVTYTEVLDYQTRVNFSCCNGNQSIVISSVLINPNNLPIEITPGPVTINGTFSYDITYNYLNAVITDSKEFYVQFTICGKTILRKHLYSAIDTCVTIPTNNVPFENELAAITLDIDNGDFGITRETFLATINLGNFECCHSGQRSKIISIDSSRITAESGLTILSPEAGDESQGTIPLSYYFDGENAIAGTVQNVFITYSICDDLVYTGYVKFTIVNTCSPDLTPTFDPVTNTNLDLDLDTMGSGDYNIEIGVSAYQCCGQSNVLYLRFLPNTYQAYTELALYGITFDFPTTVIQATNQINIPFKFNRDVYLAYKTNNILAFPRIINFDFFYLACGPVPSLNNIINQYVIGFRLDDNCTPIFSGASSTTPIYHDLYLSRGNTVPVSTEVEFYCNSCDNNSGKFNYTGFRALSNDSKLINTIPIPQLLASGSSIPFNAKPHQINLGPYTSAFPLPDFPVQKSTTIELKTNCWDGFVPVLPTVNTTYQLAINSFIADNYFRSDGGPGGLSVTNKTSAFSWNPNIDESLTIIALIAPDAVPLNLLLAQLGYTTLSAGTGSLEVEVYSLNSNTCNSFGSLIQNSGDVSILTNANIIGTGMNNSLSYDLSALSGSGGPYSGATLPLGYGFYFIKFYLKDKTADSFSVQFNIT